MPYNGRLLHASMCTVQYGTVLGLTTLLELDDTEEADGTAEDATLREVMQQALQLEVEHPGQYVRSVFGPLTRQEGPSDLVPRRVARHRDEQRRLAHAPDDRHAVQVPA